MKYLLLALMFLTGCANIPVNVPAVVHQDEPVKAVSLPWGHDDWSQELVSNFASRMDAFSKAKDIDEYCPKFNLLNAEAKAQALAFLAVAISKFESDWNPKDSMIESNGAASIGLFQLSYGDAHCPRSKAEASLMDPIVNIRCAVAIMADEVKQDGIIAAGGYTKYGAPPAKGMARYWSVLRVPDSKSKHHKADIQALAKKSPGCI